MIWKLKCLFSVEIATELKTYILCIYNYKLFCDIKYQIEQWWKKMKGKLMVILKRSK